MSLKLSNQTIGGIVGVALFLGFILSRKRGGGRKIEYVLGRWDQLSGTSVTIKQEEPFLQRHRNRAPFYARIIANRLRVRPPNLVDIVKQQTQYARSAGIDAFTYHGPPESLTGDGYGLTKMLRASFRIPGNKMKFTWAIFGKGKHGTWSKSQCKQMVNEHVAMAANPLWHRYKGRPIIYVLRPRKFDVPRDTSMEWMVAQIRHAAHVRKLPSPLIVAMEISHAYKYADKFAAAGFDAFTDYGASNGAGSQPRGQGNSYAHATAETMHLLRHSAAVAKSKGIKYLPSIVPAWDPWPRKDRQKKYHHYKYPQAGEWGARLRKARKWIEEAGGHVLPILNIYGLGENTEGATIMPLMGAPPKYEPNTMLLNETRKALK